jgi:predicted Zn-ribbon and HTH transcriptional regulator
MPSLKTDLSTEKLVNNVLATIDREREREIVSKRFGLFDRKETLEQIGETLGITRERVRQLEKSVVGRLKLSAEQGKLSQISSFEKNILEKLSSVGQIAKTVSLAEMLVGNQNREEQSRITFLAELSPSLTVVSEDDNFYPAIANKSALDEGRVRTNVEKIIGVITKFAAPKDIATIAKSAGAKDVQQTQALAGISKQLASFNGQWGLVKWPEVNPKNIRDKIYVILKENGKHMHFNEIASAIKQSDFKRKDVTTQAIHNELIKDKRFVLIGRGIYALKEWGYQNGTVADVIANVLREAKQPLHRDEIVKRVLKSRFVKETTILLNLQGKPQFKRVAKATYDLSE